MRSLRLPLGLGLAALQALVIGFVLVPIGIGALGLFVLLVWFAQDANEGMAYILIGILTVLAYGGTKMRRAWLYRPSDAVFREDQLRIEGGRRGGISFDWKEIDPSTVAVHEKTDEKGKDKRWTLQIRSVDVAETDEESEGASLREVAQAIKFRAAPSEEIAGAEKPADVLTCESCGAPVAPASEKTTKCGYCDAKVTVPKDVRERVSASEKLTKKSKKAEKLVTKLLDQPGAGSTTALLWVSFLVIGSAWPITIWAYLHLYRVQELTLLRGFALALLPFLLIADGFFLSRLRLVDRRALGKLVLTFGALPPARKGEPLRCRSCMGPLPARTAVVVECIYCDAANVTGVDLRANAQRVAKSVRSLSESLEQRFRDRRTWRWRTLASLPFFVIPPLLARDAFRAKEEVWTFTSLDVVGSNPQLSPDGKKVLYKTNEGLKLLDLETGESSWVEVERGAHCAAWLKDGRIAFMARDAIRTSNGEVLVKDTQGCNELIVSRDGASIAIVGGATIVHRIGKSEGKRVDVYDSDFGPDGNLVGEDSDGIAFYLPDGTREHVSQTGRKPRWSPDGKRIAFLYMSTLGVMNKSGWKKKTLLDNCTSCTDLRWESDGALYFVRDGRLWRGHR